MAFKAATETMVMGMVELGVHMVVVIVVVLVALVVVRVFAGVNELVEVVRD